MSLLPQYALDAMIWIPGGTFAMGSDEHYPEEAPVHRVTVDGFWMDPSPVTNRQFRAVRRRDGLRHLRRDRTARRGLSGRAAAHAQSRLACLPAAAGRGRSARLEPVVGVPLRRQLAPPLWPRQLDQGSRRSSGRARRLRDAEAYAKWAGKELPTEAEWEFAARGGLEGTEFAWGDEFAPGGKQMANTWQGGFPHENLKLDGYERTSPVGTYPANGYGLFDMIGNVWEWTTDWYRAEASG